MKKRPVSPDQLQLPAPDPGVVQLSDKYLKAGSRILDAGSGNGRNALYLARQGHDVLGVEKSPEYVETARNFANVLGSGLLKLSFEEGDIAELPLEAKSFDAVFITRVLQECGDREKSSRVVEAAQRVTRSRGLNFVTAYIGTPHEQALKKDLVIMQPGEVVESYREWDIVHYDQQISSPQQINGVTVLNSHDELVVRKPIADLSPVMPPLNQLSLEYLQRSDPELAEHMRLASPL